MIRHTSMKVPNLKSASCTLQASINSWLIKSSNKSKVLPTNSLNQSQKNLKVMVMAMAIAMVKEKREPLKSRKFWWKNCPGTSLLTSLLENQRCISTKFQNSVLTLPSSWSTEPASLKKPLTKQSKTTSKFSQKRLNS